MPYLAHYCSKASALSILLSGKIHGQVENNALYVRGYPKFWDDGCPEFTEQNNIPYEVRMVFAHNLPLRTFDFPDLPAELDFNVLYRMDTRVDLGLITTLRPASQTSLHFASYRLNKGVKLSRGEQGCLQYQSAKRASIVSVQALNAESLTRLQKPLFQRANSFRKAMYHLSGRS